ncbi:MAG TPA: trypsin-like peptidase domain-containing protein [Ktedonobacterales bacterium]|nr:trypsin-like peptidase domain-containing protein [Ktedonobacterales bacterium]
MATAILLMVIGLAGVAPVAAQDRPPGGVMANPVVRAIDLASPAVVRIATIYSAHLRLTACGVTTSLPSSGAYTIGGLGSGAFVSANGDILTADHVVDIDRQSLDNAIFSGERVANDVAAFLNAACHPTAPVTANDVANGIVQYNGLPFSTTYSAPQVLVWRSASYFGTISGGSSDATTQLSGLMKASYNEATVLQTSAFEQDDVALIHVGLTDTPSIQLDPSTELAVEDALTVIGFPGNGDVNGDPTNLLTPSINNVSVSAIKHNDNGSQLIQVGGNVEHGDSGGPALDAAGHIVGIVSFGGSDSQGITAFLRASDSALKLMRSANIDTKPGTFQKLWEQAFAAYADTQPGHWHTASREMDALSTRYPDFHGLDTYRAYADAAATREAPTTPAFQPPALPLPLPVVAAILAVVVLFLLALIIALSLRSRARRRARQQAAAVAQPAWTPAGLAPGYPQGYNGSSAQSGYAGSNGYNGYNGGYSGYGQPWAPTSAASSTPPGYAPLNGAAYGAQAQPTRPATGQARPAEYPPQTGQQPYPPAASAPTPYMPTYAPTNAPQYPGYPPRSNPPTPSSGLPLAPSVGPSAMPAAATPPPMGHVSQPAPAGPTTPAGPAASNTYNSSPAPSGPTSSPTSSPSAVPSQANPAQNGGASEFCANGHLMQPGAPRCLVCGADRAQPTPSAPSAPRDANMPPWGQNW